MRNILVAGNWKMNKTPAETIDFINSLTGYLTDKHHQEVEVMVAPTYLSLPAARTTIKDAPILLSAQDVSKNINGAFTGEVSASMLSSLPVDMCIIGHSERRAYHQESDDIINRKLQMLLATGIKPVFCIGETLEQREADETMEVVITQLESCLHEVTLETGDEIVIAYEPVWAIGTGVTATPEQAQEVHSLIRRLISKLYSSEIAEKILIIYGGSMKPSNMDELLACHDIDGGLIGGASLELDSFCRMIEIAIEKKRGV